MQRYWRFLLIGLALGLFTEFVLKLVAGIKPQVFIIAVFAYPVIISLSFAASKIVDLLTSSTWRADLLHYFGAGLGGMMIEWTLLGNGPGSNAVQLGMFAMWTTFCFGPRVLSRDSSAAASVRRKFWIAFGIVAVLLIAIVLAAPSPQARVVIAVLGLSGTYLVWSVWMLIIAWRSREPILLQSAAEGASS